MILELAKEAGEQDLSIMVNVEDGITSLSLVDKEDNEIYSAESTDALTAFICIQMFLSDPEGYLDDMRASLEAESSN